MNDKRKIIIITPDPLLPSTQLRFIEVFSLIEEIDYIVIDEKSVSYEHVVSADVIIFQRCYSPYGLLILNIAKKLRKISIYDMDDNLLEVPKESAGYIFNNYKYIIQLFLKLVDYVTCSTIRLKELLIQNNENIIIIENTLSSELFIKSVKEKSDTKKINLLISNSDYFKLLNSKIDFFSYLSQLFTDYPELTLYYIGSYTAGEDYMFSYDFKDRIKFIDFIHDYRTYISFLQNNEIDIALVPLENKEFHNYKSNIKYIEFSASGIPAIYSKVVPYLEIIKHNENGLLVNNNKEEWYQATVELINNLELRQKIINHAYEDIKENYDIEISCSKWQKILNEFMFKGSLAPETEENIIYSLQRGFYQEHQDVNRITKQKDILIQKQNDFIKELEQRDIKKTQQLHQLQQSKALIVARNLEKYPWIVQLFQMGFRILNKTYSILRKR